MAYQIMCRVLEGNYGYQAGWREQRLLQAEAQALAKP